MTKHPTDIEQHGPAQLGNAIGSAHCIANRLVLEVCRIKNHFGQRGGFSPRQWMTGRRPASPSV
eukprot:4191100-Lingulodinium_polyedra.AAC.1